jgi:ABC-2 type transport system permease protein
MNKILIIIRREYITRVRKKLFIVTTLLAPMGLVAITTIPVLIAAFSSGEKHKIELIDNSKGNYFSGKADTSEKIQLVAVNEDYNSAKKAFKKNGYTGILYISPSYNMDSDKYNVAEYYSDEQLGLNSQEAISKQLSKTVTAIKLKKINITQQQIDDLNKDVEIKSILPSAEGERAGNTGAATALGYIMGFIIYIVMLIYGTLVMRGVMEEKTNRIAEVMVSSVKPFQLMMGKIVGIGMVGLTQLAIWIVLIIALQFGLRIVFGDQLAHATQMTPAQQMGGNNNAMFAKAFSDISSLPWAYLISCFLFFFFGGYLLYASLFAAVGSAAGDEADQSLTFIVTIPIIISIMIMINTLQQPNGTLAIVASMIPFSAPVVMCARLPFDPPAWQIIVSMISLVAGFIFTTWLAGKIYRTGILMYGKKTTLRELGKWLTYKN